MGGGFLWARTETAERNGLLRTLQRSRWKWCLRGRTRCSRERLCDSDLHSLTAGAACAFLGGVRFALRQQRRLQARSHSLARSGGWKGWWVVEGAGATVLERRQQHALLARVHGVHTFLSSQPHSFNVQEDPSSKPLHQRGGVKARGGPGKEDSGSQFPTRLLACTPPPAFPSGCFAVQGTKQGWWVEGGGVWNAGGGWGRRVSSCATRRRLTESA